MAFPDIHDAPAAAKALRPGTVIADSSALIGRSPVMVKLRSSIRKVADRRSPPPTLILGPSGSGKELVARTLHSQGARASQPFIPVNCSAIPRELFESELFGHERGAFTGALARKAGLIEEAGSGVLFLDEIAEMPLDQQPKLLRTLESRTYRAVGGNCERRTDAWVIAATNVDLEERVRQGLFRRDLYYRLNGFAIRTPGLRENPEDIRVLAQVFGACLDPPVRFSADGLAWLEVQAWEGNVRELRAFVERAAILSAVTELTRANLECASESTRAGEERASRVQRVAESFDDKVGAYERDLIRKALSACGGNKQAAARTLGINRNRLVRKLHAK